MSDRIDEGKGPLGTRRVNARLARTIRRSGLRGSAHSVLPIAEFLEPR